MTPRIRSVQSIIAAALLWAGTMGWMLTPSACAEDQNTQGSATVLKTKEGLNFNVPPDWPIEKRNGVVGPIPIEEYLGRKFSVLESRLQSVERQVSAIDLRLRVIEEAVQKSSRRLQSSEAAPARPAATEEPTNAPPTTPAP